MLCLRSNGFFFLVVISAVLTALLNGACWAESTPSKLEAKKALLAPNNKDVLLGNKDASVHIVEYHALTCPYCGHFSKTVMPKIRENYIDSGKISYIIREVPVDEQSLKAILIMRCLPKHQVDAFRTMILHSQDNWWGKSDYMTIFMSYASLGGTPESKIEACMSSKELLKEVLNDKLTSSRELGISAIPTFFVNGVKYEGSRSWKQWKEIIDNLLPSEGENEPDLSHQKKEISGSTE